jgi:hypothetical protein
MSKRFGYEGGGDGDEPLYLGNEYFDTWLVVGAVVNLFCRKLGLLYEVDDDVDDDVDEDGLLKVVPIELVVVVAVVVVSGSEDVFL